MEILSPSKYAEKVAKDDAAAAAKNKAAAAADAADEALVSLVRTLRPTVLCDPSGDTSSYRQRGSLLNPTLFIII